METAVKISSKKITTLLILSFVLLLITPSLGIILIGGSIPTLIAYIFDNGTRGSMTVCVGMMNFAGLLPILIYFYEYCPIWGAVITDIYSLKNWGVIYSSFYWILFLLGPPRRGR